MKRGGCRIQAVGYFGQRLKALIEEKSSMTQLSHELHVGHERLYSWVKGKSSPSTKNMEKLTQFFGVTADELLKPPQEPKPLTLDEIANMAANRYSGTQWGTYGKLKAYMDTHNGELPPAERGDRE